MKKTTLILTAALAMLAGQAFAENAKVTTQPTKPAPSIGSAPVSAPQTPVLKDFKLARDLEIERLKFARAQGDVLQKCLEGVKSDKEFVECMTTYRTAITEQLSKMVQAGRFAAAYNMSPGSVSGPAAGAPSTKN